MIVHEDLNEVAALTVAAFDDAVATLGEAILQLKHLEREGWPVGHLLPVATRAKIHARKVKHELSDEIVRREGGPNPGE